jgi:flagellar basal-body rod protein FlgF
MDSTSYITLSRQVGLLDQMDAIANNIANSTTTGFKREGTLFSEWIGRAGEAPSVSMGYANTRVVDVMQAGVQPTGGTFDLAIQGDGFFLIQGPNGQQMLTRAGAFTQAADGTVQTADGFPLLDESGAPIFVPPGVGNITVAQDGTISADGAPLAKLGLWNPADPLTLTHQQGTLFTANGYAAAPGGAILQGFLEESNVNPINEIASMIEVQRAYQLGQSFLDREDDRARNVISTLGR